MKRLRLWTGAMVLLASFLIPATAPAQTLPEATSSVTIAQAKPKSKKSEHRTGSILINIYDGRRQLVPDGTEVLVRLLDQNHKEIFTGFMHGPSVRLDGVLVHDDVPDFYIVV